MKKVNHSISNLWSNLASRSSLASLARATLEGKLLTCIYFNSVTRVTCLPVNCLEPLTVDRSKKTFYVKDVARFRVKIQSGLKKNANVFTKPNCKVYLFYPILHILCVISYFGINKLRKKIGDPLATLIGLTKRQCANGLDLLPKTHWDIHSRMCNRLLQILRHKFFWQFNLQVAHLIMVY